MDKIQKFEFELDISNCDMVYDYAAKEEIHRPASGVWDESVFVDRGSMKDTPVNDENEKMRIALMDEAIMDTRFLEKKIKVKSADVDEAGKSTGSDFNLKASSSRDDLQYGGMDENMGHLPRRLLPVYKRGDVVKGSLILSLKEALDAEALKMKFIAEVKVNVRIYSRNGYNDDTRYEKFVDISNTLWLRDEKKDFAEEFHMMSVTDSTACSSKLIPAGTHTFHFEHLIPNDAPQAVPPVVVSTSNCAHLIWRLKAKIEKSSNVLRYGNIATHRGIWVEHPLDISTFPDFMNPVTVEETLDTGMIQFWKTGHRVKVTVFLQRAVFIKGENIPIEIEVDNQSSSEIAKVEARIRMHGKARLSDSRLSLSNTINIKSEKVTEGPIACGMCPVINWELPWDFSESSADGRLLPVGELEESKLIEVKYHIVVKIKRRGLHRNMEIEIPIKVGNKDSSKDSGPSATARSTNPFLS